MVVGGGGLIAGWDGGLGPKMVQQSESAVIVFFSSFSSGNAFCCFEFSIFLLKASVLSFLHFKTNIKRHTENILTDT